MKKRNSILLVSLLATLVGCSYFEGITLPNLSSGYGSLVNPSSNNSSSSTINSSTINSSTIIDKPYVYDSPLQNVLSLDPDFEVGLPSTGDVKVLVIPVEIGNNKFSDDDLEKINLAFNGTSQDTGFESVSSYYYKSSKGKLKIDAEISPVFKTGKSQSYYELRYNSGYDIDCEIIDNAMPLLDDLYDFSEFDYNRDSYIDAIYLIYSCDYSVSDSSPFWAWCYEHNGSKKKYDKVEPGYFVWASFDFFNDPIGEYHSININAETIIHETGHLFGLDDYYDYDEGVGPDGGLGGAAMMDCNVGDQDSFSKLLLGWANATTVTEEGTYTLNPSESSNECLIIPLRENKNSFFGEYLLIDYYTPTGLNKTQAGNYGLFTRKGVRIYHVDARIDSNIGSQKNLNGYYTIFSFNNSDTKHKLIKMIEADKNNSIAKTGLASNNDLFSYGSKLDQIYNYDNELFNYTIKVTSIEETATITVTKNEEK